MQVNCFFYDFFFLLGIESSETNFDATSLKKIDEYSDEYWNELSKNGAIIAKVPKKLHGEVLEKFLSSNWKTQTIRTSTQKIGVKFSNGLAMLEITNSKNETTVEDFTQKSKIAEKMDPDDIVEELFLHGKPIEVEYGDDILFSEYEGHGFDFNQIKSTLSDLIGDMDGVTKAYHYIGYPKTFAGFHTEDSNLLSINFMVDGELKVWYVIPAEYSEAFEKYVKERYPCEYCHELPKPKCCRKQGKCEKFCDNVLSHKDFFVDPNDLKKAGIKVITYLQKKGDVIITAPGSYHAVVNGAYNLNIATNFTSKKWHEHFQATKVPCSCAREKSWATEQIDSQNAARRYRKEKEFVKRITKVRKLDAKCERCDYVCHISNVRKHQLAAEAEEKKKGKKPIFKSQFCDLVFCTKTLCSRHELDMHNDSPKSSWRKCEVCQPVRYFTDRKRLSEHKMKGEHRFKKDI